jgi:hypothetical protein
MSQSSSSPTGSGGSNDADDKHFADAQFLDDLSATRRFMSYLLSKGTKIPPEIPDAMGILSTFFAEDLQRYDKQESERSMSSNSIWFWRAK